MAAQSLWSDGVSPSPFDGEDPSWLNGLTMTTATKK